jgi:hypothetical protein
MVYPIWIKVFLVFLISVDVFAVDYDCKNVSSKSLVVSNESEKLNLCFHPSDDSYFISQECKNIGCKSLSKIKSTKLEFSESMRPGKSWCRSLGGAVEPIEIEGIGKQFRCLFTEDSISISLNLLESWNGKIFAGPKLIEN